MTSDATKERVKTNGASRAGGRTGIQRAEELGGALRAAGSGLGDAVGAARAAVPELARTSQELADDVMHRIKAGNDEQVTAGVAMSLGLAIGMLLGSAPRLLIAAALVPVAAMGLVLMERRSGASPRGA
ncbi:MAG: hypothetical protein EPO36_06955 [Chloroflexota bacterium]|nr:MAG: hypothetical protein EPO36_06955 [Chloroflexota bacterium]